MPFSQDWRRYARVTRLGSADMPIMKLGQLELGCSRYIGCRLYENLLIDLRLPDLDDCQQSVLQMKVWGRISQGLHIPQQSCRTLGDWLAARGNGAKP